MTATKRTKEAERSPFTMDDIARRFLTTAPTPKQPAPKRKARKAKQPAK